MNKINMFNNEKETIVQAVIRSIKNADVNNRIVELYYNTAKVLIYPNDDIPQLLKEIKKQLLVNQIASLKAQMA